MNPLLPRLFRIAFAVLATLAAFASVCIVAAMLADPQLPAEARFGPVHGEFLGQPASFALHPGVRGVAKPVLLIHAVFFAALFELLRRLFRNVGRGESFTQESVWLVQFVPGGSGRSL